MKLYIISNPEKCSGCRICELVCALKNEGVSSPKKARIRVVRVFPGFDVAVACRFCEEPPCVHMCPRSALSVGENGIIKVDKEKCDGCGICVEACEFGAITLHPDNKLPISCDLCGGEPECVKYCPECALEITSAETIAKRARMISFKRYLESFP
ncbi:4Fe-4S dicluster domain-containing protein [Candidatus Alkanophaga liquidiphilum]|nr:Fe-S-cluster-containing dehydrogenase component [Candidatus Alkanophaga liquidiphilum]RLG36547.1 MAG: 4Fe-4S dicluster domain-containing protein [Candidatus Alkanophagales archaeon]